MTCTLSDHRSRYRFDMKSAIRRSRSSLLSGALAILFLAAAPMHAHLGESLESMIERLGPPAAVYELPEFPGVAEYRWQPEANKLVHEIWVFENQSIFESLTHYEAVEAQTVRSFLKHQNPEASWRIRYKNSTHVEFVTDDKSLGAKVWMRDGRVRKLVVGDSSEVNRAVP